MNHNRCSRKRAPLGSEKGRLRVCLGVKKIQVPEPVKFVLVESGIRGFGIRNKAQGFH